VDRSGGSGGESHLVAKPAQPPCEVLGCNFSLVFVEVGLAQLLIGLLKQEHVIEHHENLSGHGQDGALFSSSRRKAMIERLE